MAIEVITREDLNEFRSLLLNDLKKNHSIQTTTNKTVAQIQ